MPQSDEEKRAYWRKYDAEHKEERRQKAREHYAKVKDTPEYKAKNQARAAKWYAEHKDDPEVKADRARRGAKWREDNREIYLAWRRANRKKKMADPEYRERYNAKKRADLNKRLEPLRKLLAEARSCGCLLCDERDLEVLDFHHVDPEAKSFQITPHQISHKPLDLVREEIAKCIVLCANCHRRYHAGTVDLPDTFPEQFRHWDAEANHYTRRRKRVATASD